MKVIVHVQITRVISIYHSYFLYNILWGKTIYKFPGKYCLNVSKQLEYKSSECIYFFFFYLKLNVFSIFYFYVFNVLLSMLNRCMWCHFGHFHDQNIEKVCYSRMRSRLIRTEWPHSDQSFSVLFWIKYV